VWTPTVAEALSALVRPDSLGVGGGAASTGAGGGHARGAAPLLMREAEVRRRRASSPSGFVNDFSLSLYTAPPPVGAAPPRARNATARMGMRRPTESCRSVGHRMLWNAALHPFRGAPRTALAGEEGERCQPLTIVHADSAQECCAMCAAVGAAGAAGPGEEARGSGCSSWTYFAPRCMWSASCVRGAAHRVLMWGAVSGYEVHGRSLDWPWSFGVNASA
jgi:hypothetical protein